MHVPQLLGRDRAAVRAWLLRLAFCAVEHTAHGKNGPASKRDHEQPSKRTPWNGAELFRPILWTVLEEWHAVVRCQNYGRAICQRS